MIYYDGQFDDSRLLINLVATAFEQGATLLNYAPVTALLKDAEGFVDGVRFRDAESGRGTRGPRAGGDQRHRTVRRRRAADGGPAVEPMVAASQGIHLVFDSSFLPGDSAIMVPHTSDGRVMFAIPWHGHTLVGTTDTPVAVATLEPVAHGAGGGVHPADRVALSGEETVARRRAKRVCGNPSVGALRAMRRARPHCRAIMSFASRTPGW